MIGVVSGIALIQLFINLLIYLAGCTFGRTGRTASARSGRILLKCFATENIADRRIILIFVSLEIQSGCSCVSACQILRLWLRSDWEITAYRSGSCHQGFHFFCYQVHCHRRAHCHVAGFCFTFRDHIGNGCAFCMESEVLTCCYIRSLRRLCVCPVSDQGSCYCCIQRSVLVFLFLIGLSQNEGLRIPCIIRC